MESAGRHGPGRSELRRDHHHHRLGQGASPGFRSHWNGGPFGIAYIVVSGTQARVPVTFDYDDESDPGPDPIPAKAPIEGGAGSSEDRHVLIVDRDAWKLYELFAAYPQANGSWHAGSGPVFDLRSNALRPAGWTSADAAGSDFEVVRMTGVVTPSPRLRGSEATEDRGTELSARCRD